MATRPITDDRQAGLLRIRVSASSPDLPL
jgi:hypothetical protein